jgi:sRNA-binding regulator protein Hfq
MPDVLVKRKTSHFVIYKHAVVQDVTVSLSLMLFFELV